MPKASPLAIATRTVKNYIQDATSYYREYNEDELKIQKAEVAADDELGNKQSIIDQLKLVKQQTLNTYLRFFDEKEERSLPSSVEKLREELEKAEERVQKDEQMEMDIKAAKESILKAESLIAEGAKLSVEEKK